MSLPATIGDATEPATDAETLSFRSAPTKLGNGFKFVTGGDMGVSNVAKQITTQASKTDPDFALLGGDLAYANGRSTKAWLSWLDDWHKLARTSKGHLIPIVIVIGNHEMGSGSRKNKRGNYRHIRSPSSSTACLHCQKANRTSRWISAVISASTP